MTALQTIHVLAALVVLAEALNKLERTTPFAPGLTLRARLTDGLKALAWGLLALGAGCTVAAPLLIGNGMHANYMPVFDAAPPLLYQTSMMVGFAALIISNRLREG